jgi:gluconolactonase
MPAWLSLVILTSLAGAEPAAERELLKTFRDEFVVIIPGQGKFPAAATLAPELSVARYEVPQNLWEAVMGSNPSKWKGKRNSVEMLSYAEAEEFCTRVTTKLKQAELIKSSEFVRLPTEAEWEYAAAAGTSTRYSFGDDVKQLDDYAWHTGNAQGNDPPVGAKKPNAWGLYDVHGYLWEWCSSPQGPVLRSGSWKDRAAELETKARRVVDSQLKDDAVGLRCVLVQGPSAPPTFQPREQARFIPTDRKLELLWSEGEFTEGPALAPDGSILFSDIGTKIFRFDPRTKETGLFRDPSGRSNGLMFDGKGRLIACEGANTGGNRRISITTGIAGGKDGKTETLSDNFSGQRFNSPNDLAVDGQGRVYFTDPRYVGDDPRDLDFEAVFLVEQAQPGQPAKTSIATREVQKPNGILVSPDGKTVYVADNNPNGNKQLVSFQVQADGSLKGKRVLFDFVRGRGIDGMTLDSAGNIYATAGTGEYAGIYVFSSAGEQLAWLSTPGDPTNCTFGVNQAEGSYLYITAATGPKQLGKSLKYGLSRILLPVQGHHVVKLQP